MENLLYDPHVMWMCIACICSASWSVILLVWAIATYNAYRPRLACCYNELLVAALITELCQCIQKIFFTSYTLLNQGLPYVLCDVNGSLSQWIDITAIAFLIAFFISMSNHRHYWESGWNSSVFRIAPLIGLLSLCAVWAVIANRKSGITYVDAPYFRQNMAWCWIPKHSDYVESYTAMSIVRALLGYTPALGVGAAAVFAYWKQRRSTQNETWLSKPVMVRRFLGLSIFPALMYAMGMSGYYLGGDGSEVEIVHSAVYPLLGGVLSIVFMWTESCFGWLPDSRMRAIRRVFQDGNDVVEGTALAAPLSPKKNVRRASELTAHDESWLHPTAEAVAHSFTATVRAMLCDAVEGHLVPSSRREQTRGSSFHSGRTLDGDDGLYSTVTTESRFSHYEGGYEDESVSRVDFRISVQPPSQRDVDGTAAAAPSGRASGAPSLPDQGRRSKEAVDTSDSSFTTRSSVSMQWMSPQVHVVNTSLAGGSSPTGGGGQRY